MGNQRRQHLRFDKWAINKRFLLYSPSHPLNRDAPERHDRLILFIKVLSVLNIPLIFRYITDCLVVSSFVLCFQIRLLLRAASITVISHIIDVFSGHLHLSLPYTTLPALCMMLSSSVLDYIFYISGCPC